MTELGHILIMRLINKYKEGVRWWRLEYSFGAVPFVLHLSLVPASPGQTATSGPLALHFPSNFSFKSGDTDSTSLYSWE